MYFFAARRKAAFCFVMVALSTLLAATSLNGVSGSAAHAAPTDQSVVFHGTSGTVPLLRRGFPAPPASAPTHAADELGPFNTGDDLDTMTRVVTDQPAVSGAPLSNQRGGLQHNFIGLTDQDQAIANGGVGNGELTPPDQGLCVGHDPGVPGATVVFEPINSALRETDVNGQSLPGHPLLGNHDVTFSSFWEPGAFSDPRCFFDPATQTFFFTVIGTVQQGPDAGQTSVDIAVFNVLGFAVYQIDSSFGGKFFGDQPHVGYDSNNLYVTTDAFNATGAGFFGSDLFAVPRLQLVLERDQLNEVIFAPVSLAGIPIRTLEPAISTSPTQIEYLMNSFPFTATARNPVSNQLGFWKVEHGVELLFGHTQEITLTGQMIQSETYAFPVGAVSTGTGVTTNGITSEAILNPDDSRLLQMQFIDGHLWSALDTALAVGNDSTLRDGIAWFDVDARTGQVAEQGYIASAGSYLLYPAILHNHAGITAITFSITSATLNPSAAFVVRNNHATSFGDVQIAAPGGGPHLSFSDTLPQGGRPRWGDYSAAAFGPDGEHFWLATEYIDAAHPDPFDNWATRIFEM